VTTYDKPDLVVGLVRTRDSTERPADEGVGILPHVAEVIATVANVGAAIAEPTATRFWLRSASTVRELRIVETPELPPGEEVEVTALWDLRADSGEYAVIVTADAFAQIDELRKDNNMATVHVTVRSGRVEVG
jgi:hypothetical protein